MSSFNSILSMQHPHGCVGWNFSVPSATQVFPVSGSVQNGLLTDVRRIARRQSRPVPVQGAVSCSRRYSQGSIVTDTAGSARQSQAMLYNSTRRSVKVLLGCMKRRHT